MRLLALCLISLTLLGCDNDPLQEDALVSTGRQLFNSAKFDPGGSLSCGTCHPQGDMDGRRWHLAALHDSTNGVPDSLDTPTLFGVAETAPYLWRGQGGSDLRAVTRSVIENILGGSATEPELDALVAYQQSLRVPANPWSGSGGLTDTQQRGKLVFDGAGKCGACHSGPNLTGQFAIQIRPATLPFDIPSLRWVFATAPYFHDGSAPTLQAVIDHYDNITPAQMTTWGWNALGIYDIRLNEQEKADLFEYLRTL